jgi:hypothetical protein
MTEQLRGRRSRLRSTGERTAKPASDHMRWNRMTLEPGYTGSRPAAH